MIIVPFLRLWGIRRCVDSCTRKGLTPIFLMALPLRLDYPALPEQSRSLLKTLDSCDLKRADRS